MRLIKELKDTILDNWNCIGKIFGDEFTQESIDSLETSYLQYNSTIDLTPQDNKSFSIPFTKFNCVYFLLQGDCVVYVGQTAYLCARLATHVSDGKEFDSVSWFEVSQDNMLMIEAFNISYHNPELNKEKPTMKELILMLARKVR